MSNKKYRLEFSENQQSFHMAYLEDIPNTNGYITILDQCTEHEKELFKAYVLKDKSDCMSISPERKITLEEVRKAAQEFKEKFKEI